MQFREGLCHGVTECKCCMGRVDLAVKPAEQFLKWTQRDDSHTGLGSRVVDFASYDRYLVASRDQLSMLKCHVANYTTGKYGIRPRATVESNVQGSVLFWNIDVGDGLDVSVAQSLAL